MKKATISKLIDYINCKKCDIKFEDLTIEEIMAYISHYMHNIGTEFEESYSKGAELYNVLIGRDPKTKISAEDRNTFLVMWSSDTIRLATINLLSLTYLPVLAGLD
jgi:hypothetical protein